MITQKSATLLAPNVANTSHSHPHIRILVADDHLVYRIGIRNLLATEPGFKVVGEAPDGVQAIEFYRRLRPDVLLLDLRMPQTNGIEVVNAIRKNFSDACILIVTSYQSEEEIFQVLQAGALGYILKDMGRESLIEAIRAVYARKRWVSSTIEKQLTERALRQHLTTREMEVLRLLAIPQTFCPCRSGIRDSLSLASALRAEGSLPR
ncbi:MAG: response regulator [Terracidiphilus sp.]